MNIELCDRRKLLTLAGVSGLSLLGTEFTPAQEKERAAEFVVLSELVLSEPIVNIHGPFPTLIRKAKVGDLIQVQMTYPIAPPFPASARLVLGGRLFSSVGVFRTEGKIVAWNKAFPAPPIGVGYLSAFVKAMNAGKGSFVVEIKLDDGVIKNVPFEFEIEMEEKK